jgi:hypothetical protein
MDRPSTRLLIHGSATNGCTTGHKALVARFNKIRPHLAIIKFAQAGALSLNGASGLQSLRWNNTQYLSIPSNRHSTGHQNKGGLS